MAKKYSVNMQDDEIISVEVNGVRYKTLDQVPDEDDRDKLQALMASSSGMDLEMPTEQPAALPKFFPFIFLGVSILMLLITAISAVIIGRGLAIEKSTPGYVVDLVSRRDSNGNEYFYPLVEFYLPDNSRQTVQLPEGSWPPAYEKGQAVTVAYDPAQPRNARVLSTGGTITLWTLPIITGVLCLAFSAATWLVFWILKPEPAQKAINRVAINRS